MSVGGLYEPDTLRKMETFLQQGDLQQAISGRIADQARLPTDVSSHLSPKDMFPSLESTPFLWGLWDRTLDFTDSFGHLVAVLIGAWTILQFLSAFTKWVYAAVVLRRVPGFRFWWTPCLDCILARQVARVEEGIVDQEALVQQIELQRQVIEDLQQRVEALQTQQSAGPIRTSTVVHTAQPAATATTALTDAAELPRERRPLLGGYPPL